VNAEPSAELIDAVIGTVERLIDRCELEDSANLAKRLASRCAERDVLQQKLAILKSASPEASAPPTEEWVVGQLSEIRAVLSNAGPAAHAALRGLLDGRITANEIKTPGKRRYFHRLTLQLRLHVAISADAVSGHADLDCGSWRARASLTKKRGNNKSASHCFSVNVSKARKKRNIYYGWD